MGQYRTVIFRSPDFQEETRQKKALRAVTMAAVWASLAAVVLAAGLTIGLYVAGKEMSHTTAEVFIIHSGAWRFYWGVDGTEGEVILKKGDIASFPTNMFRGFQNVSDEEALMFVVLGENDPGVITWTPKLLKDAKESGMVLMNDNSLIDTEKQKITDETKVIQPLKDNELESYDHYYSEDIEKFVIRFNDLIFCSNIFLRSTSYRLESKNRIHFDTKKYTL